MGSGAAGALLALLVWNCAGAAAPCAENSRCREESEAGILACSGSCRARLSLESPLFPGSAPFRPLSAGLRRYVMSHFRWNRFGRPNASDANANAAGKREESSGIPGSSRLSGEEGKDGKRSYSMEHFRWGKPVGRKRRPVKVYPNGAEEESEENSRPESRREEPWEEEEEGEEEEEEEFRDSPWNSRKEKRYGGFMSSERIRTPLVTLFKNAIGKSFSKDGQ